MRTAEITRSTKETQITVWLSLDGGPVEISTGVGFFDHMLNSFAVHGGLGLKVHTEGDLYGLPPYDRGYGYRDRPGLMSGFGG